MGDFKPERFDVALTPSTIGQFVEGGEYGARGVVTSVSLTNLGICISSNKREMCKKCPVLDCHLNPNRKEA